MPLLRWMLLIVTISVALAGCTPVVSPGFKGHRLPANIAAITGARAEKLKDQFSKLVSARGILAAGVGVIRKGHLVWTDYFGEQSPGISASKWTLFNVASITKTVSAETILRLAAAGKLDLDESMARYWVDPDVVNDARHTALTPRMALAQMTGFPNSRLNLPDGHLRFLHDPGGTFGYSGEGLEYVARYAEKKLGTDFEALARQYVFDPIAATSAALSPHPKSYNRIAVVTDKRGTHKPYCRPDGWCRPEVSAAYFYAKSHDGLVIFLSGPNTAALGAMAEAIRLIDPDSVLPGRYERWHAAALKESP